jgi:hypothetical protein
MWEVAEQLSELLLVLPLEPYRPEPRRLYWPLGLSLLLQSVPGFYPRLFTCQIDNGNTSVYHLSVSFLSLRFQVYAIVFGI